VRNRGHGPRALLSPLPPCAGIGPPGRASPSYLKRFTLKDGVTAGRRHPATRSLGAYLNRIGLPDRAVVYLTQAAPGDLAMLSFEDAAKLGIEVELFRPLQSGPSAAPSEPAQAPAISPEPFTPAAPTAEGRRCLRSPCGSISDLSSGLEWYIGPDANAAQASRERGKLGPRVCKPACRGQAVCDRCVSRVLKRLLRSESMTARA
jgi:hypothetical protein